MRNGAAEPAPAGRPELPDLRCERCGVLDAPEIAGRRLCEDCYGILGSCCLEFGADDLWPRDD